MTRKRKKPASSDRTAFDSFGHDVLTRLEKSGLEHLVIGGLAVIAAGVPRTTADVDVVVFGDESAIVRFLDAALGEGFTADRDTELEALRTTGTLRIRRGAQQLDVIVASLPFERNAFDRAVETTLFGVRVRLPTAEDLLVFKILAGREKDLVDAVGIARRHLPHLKLAQIEAAIREVADLAEDASLVTRLDDVVRKARADAT